MIFELTQFSRNLKETASLVIIEIFRQDQKTQFHIRQEKDRKTLKVNDQYLEWRNNKSVSDSWVLEKENKSDEEPMEKIKQLQAELELEKGNKGFQKVAVVREQAEKELKVKKKLGKQLKRKLSKKKMPNDI